jgi:hypothetical protein
MIAAVSKIQVGYDPSHLWDYHLAKYKLPVLFSSLTLLRGLSNLFLLTIVGQGRLLMVEECFYLSAPLLILGLRDRLWQLAAYQLMSLGIGLGLVVLFVPFHESIYGLFGSMKFMLNWTFFGCRSEFLLGIALDLFMARRPALSESPRRGWATVTSMPWMLACLYARTFFEKEVSTANIGQYLTSLDAILKRNAILPIRSWHCSEG